MSQLLLLFALPIGIIFMFADFRQQKINRAIAEKFIEEVRGNEGLSDEQKSDHIKKMFILNRYTIATLSPTAFVASRKHLNLGAAIISFAIVPLYLGVLVFALYFIFLKKPERWEMDLSGMPLPEDTSRSSPTPA